MLAGRPNVWVDTSSSLYALEPEEAARIIRHGAFWPWMRRKGESANDTLA